ncbi:MAG: glycosyltransferase family 2 protein [Lysobacteraceae bacterium]|nr:MAG: glycosyltransferase family 2 protein [Xanthomonadaceae bacterium]
MIDLAVLILTHNEERHIARAIASISTIAAQVFVVDSGSTDRTVDIAEQLGAVVLRNKFINYARQFQWGLDNAPITSAWVMRLDADEIIEPDLVAEIAEKLPALPTDVAGINLDRKHIFMGRWVRHGGRYPLRLLRVWRHGQGRIEDRWMDEHMVVWGGRTVNFKGGFSDHNLNDLTFFTDKHNKYATREAIDALNQKLDLFPRDEALSSDSASLQASFKRWAKERIYNRLPFTLSATLYFLWRYFFQLGLLDGRSGLVYHVLQGFWYRFLVGAKVMELEREIAGVENKRDMLEIISRLTGHQLGPEQES